MLTTVSFQFNAWNCRCETSVLAYGEEQLTQRVIRPQFKSKAVVMKGHC